MAEDTLTCSRIANTPKQRHTDLCILFSLSLSHTHTHTHTQTHTRTKLLVSPPLLKTWLKRPSRHIETLQQSNSSERCGIVIYFQGLLKFSTHPSKGLLADGCR